ncbi:MAG TPA: hypothetical protein VIL30_12280 [Ramlibacter sp.]
MPSINPYAPPKAIVADVPAGVQSAAAPVLWNPFAAGCWSLLFTPVFGAFLHMKNWEALGEPEKARKSKGWAIGSLVFFGALMLASLVVPDSKLLDSVTRAAGFGLLFGWYYSAGKEQQTVVKERFGADYGRRGWLKPILLAVLAIVGAFIALVITGLVLDSVSGKS